MAEEGRSGTPEGGTARRRRRRRRKPSTARSKAASAGGRTAPEAATTEAGAARITSRRKAQEKGRKRKPAGTKARTRKARTTKASTRKGRRAAPRVPTKREISAGGVLYRRDEEGIEVVLASRRTRRGQLAWGLAKGGLEDDESMEEAAVREVREETGLRGEIEASLGETKYFYVWEDVRIRKTVHFFLMRHVGGDVGDRDDEMEEIRWFPLDRALKRAAYRGEREVLGRAAELLR